MDQALPKAADDSKDEPRVAILPGVAEPTGENVPAERPPAANATPEADTPAPVIEAALSQADHTASVLRAAATADEGGGGEDGGTIRRCGRGHARGRSAGGGRAGRARHRRAPGQSRHSRCGR